VNLLAAATIYSIPTLIIESTNTRNGPKNGEPDIVIFGDMPVPRKINAEAPSGAKADLAGLQSVTQSRYWPSV
jgi:hypothetical protein